jgi:hypothetical protein
LIKNDTYSRGLRAAAFLLPQIASKRRIWAQRQDGHLLTEKTREPPLMNFCNPQNASKGGFGRSDTLPSRCRHAAFVQLL